MSRHISIYYIGLFASSSLYITALARAATPEQEKTEKYFFALKKRLRKPERVSGQFVNDFSFNFTLRTTGLYLMRTLLGKILACVIMTREIMGGVNMAELVQNHQLFPVVVLPVTSASKKNPKFQENLLVSFCPRCICWYYDQWWYFSFHSHMNRVSIYHNIFLRSTVCYKIKQVFSLNNRN